ncbi:MAG: hypothetical protein HC836_20380 [Richelia sp. RM2_1_2]|nr:hypothetical protein [Richelia sp. SM1_7_0]NJN12432.1 hypothetical protein [Richelia sp. RM1_1_1]NJO60532.1 hypothetical protein [Richelia sp. RM2_1_2]
MELVKAKLVCIDNGGNIEFMFNPSQLAFEGIVETSENSGARTQKQGKPKVSFSNIKAYKVTINNILFDTYEEGEDVVKKYIDKFKKAVEFSSGKERPPVYRFVWGDNIYLRCCFIEKLSYKLTMFLPNGTPVRAVIDSLSLKEADEPKPNQSLATPTINNKTRQTDSMKNKNKK